MDYKEEYLEGIKKVIIEEDINEVLKITLLLEKEVLPILLKDKDIAAYIIWNWKVRVDTFGQYIYFEDPKVKFINDVKKGDRGAIKLWGYFKDFVPKDKIESTTIDNWKGIFENLKVQELEDEDIYSWCWEYILAFCEFKITDEGYVFYNPNYYDPKELKGKLRSKEKASDAVGMGILGSILGIPGISLLAKWEDYDVKKRQARMFHEIDEFNHFSFIFEINDEMEEMRSEMQWEVEN